MQHFTNFFLTLKSNLQVKIVYFFFLPNADPKESNKNASEERLQAGSCNK